MNDTKIPEYTVTSTYGKIVRTVPNPSVDMDFLRNLNEKLDGAKAKYVGTEKMSQKDIGHFMAMVDDTLKMLITHTGKCSRFSEEKDQLKNPIIRYVVKDNELKFNYIVDAYVTLNVGLRISPLMRFWYTHVTNRWEKIDGSQFVPRYEFRIRVWNTPVSHYMIVYDKAELPVSYSDKIERFRSIVGLPSIYKPEEIKLYERADYDIRRAIFGEGFDLSWSGTAKPLGKVS